MEFKLPVDYKDEELELDARNVSSGYRFCIEVMVEEQPWHFERDEEGQFRAMVPYGTENPQAYKADRGLLEAVAQQLQALFDE